MAPQQLLRSLARVLPLLILSLAVPSAVLSQQAAHGPSELTPEARAKLAQAADDARLAPWQSDLMLRMARPGATATLDPSAAGHGAALSPVVSGAADGEWAQPVPTLASHIAIYDPLRDRMVIFGGGYYGGSWQYLNDVWALSLAGTPAWTQLTPTGTPPGFRSYHSAIYDPVRDRIVIFGGGYYSGSWNYLNEVWALSLTGTPTWTQLTPSGTPPVGRLQHSAIYDPVRDRMVVFGGSDISGTLRNDVWALSLAGTPAWTQVTPTGTPPIGRCLHSAIYDLVRDRMVVFGGNGSGSPYRNDVWALSLAGTPAWTLLSPTGTPPTGREWHGAIYDPARDRMVVFGGRWGSSTFLNDVWALSLSGAPVWAQLSPTGTPPSAREGHSVIYDPVRDRMVAFGGFYSYGMRHDLNDAWALSLAAAPAWTQLSPDSAPPGVRHGHSAIYDPVRDRMVIFGGSDGMSYFNDVWVLSFAGKPTWTLITPAGTPPDGRAYDSAIYDPVRHRMVVFGGYYYRDDVGQHLNDAWALSLGDAPAWTQLAPSGSPPDGRAFHSAIYDPLRDRMVAYGGYGYFNEVWALSLGDTPVWTQLIAVGGPASGERYYHTAICDPLRDRMVVFGGHNGLDLCNDVWALSLGDTSAWTELTPTGTSPSARIRHSAVYDPLRDRMVVFGGQDSYDRNDVWALSLSGTPVWSQLAPSGDPPGTRHYHSAIYDPARDRMAIFGGVWGSSTCFNDTWALEWGGTTAVDDPQVRPLIGGLRPPAPNPTRGTIAVNYTLAQAGRVQLGVYDVSGRLVRQLMDGEHRAGSGTAVWNGTDESGARVAAGVYFVRLAGPEVREMRKVIRLQ